MRSGCAPRLAVWTPCSAIWPLCSSACWIPIGARRRECARASAVARSGRGGHRRASGPAAQAPAAARQSPRAPPVHSPRPRSCRTSNRGPTSLSSCRQPGASTSGPPPVFSRGCAMETQPPARSSPVPALDARKSTARGSVRCSPPARCAACDGARAFAQEVVAVPQPVSPSWPSACAPPSRDRFSAPGWWTVSSGSSAAVRATTTTWISSPRSSTPEGIRLYVLCSPARPLSDHHRRVR